MANGASLVSVNAREFATVAGPVPPIGSLLVKPASALCNLDCDYCFYLDREADPYKDLPARRMTLETLEHLVQSFLFYSYPNSTFAFQGGEPMLAGLLFFEKLIEFQMQHGRPGQSVSNALQTNGILIDSHWCQLFRKYNWLLGVSLDGPSEIHDAYRHTKDGRGTWSKVIHAVETLQKHKVDFNILCVLSQANVGKPRELYRFNQSLGVDNLQFIPLAEFGPAGERQPYAVTAEQYGQFLLDLFEIWWPDRRKMRIRFFDNLAEALAGWKPGACALHETCDSYAVVEYNGDVYPCDFFVEQEWKLGNVTVDSWDEIAHRSRRMRFASKKRLVHDDCRACEFESICHRGCPKFRHGQHGNFQDLDYFCRAYKMIFARAIGPLSEDLAQLLR